MIQRDRIPAPPMGASYGRAWHRVLGLVHASANTSEPTGIGAAEANILFGVKLATKDSLDAADAEACSLVRGRDNPTLWTWAVEVHERAVSRAYLTAVARFNEAAQESGGVPMLSLDDEHATWRARVAAVISPGALAMFHPMVETPDWLLAVWALGDQADYRVGYDAAKGLLLL